jgi:uncharacterized protein YlaI
MYSGESLLRSAALQSELNATQMKNKLLKSYFSYTCHDRFSKRAAMMTPAALNAGDRIFVLDKDQSST